MAQGCWKSITQNNSVMSVLLRCSIEFSLQCVFAAVGKGIYVYNLQMKRVIAFQRTAHDSTVLHITKVPNRCKLNSFTKKMSTPERSI